MKIAVLSFYSGLVNRGVETYVHELCQNLSKSNKVLVFQAGNSLYNTHYQIQQIPISPDGEKSNFPTGVKKRLFIDYWSLKIKDFTQKVIPELIKYNPQIIIATNNGWQVFLLRKICHRIGSKLIVSSQSGIGKWGPGYEEWINTLSGVDQYVMLTKVAQERFRLFAPWQKTVVIPNGVNLEKFHPGVNPANLQLPKPIVLVVSALTPAKRVSLAIKAVAKMKTRASLIVLGTGNKSQVREVTSLGQELLSKRFLLKQVSRDKIASYFTAADVFTFPSESSDAFGISIVEAMACNLPVVVSKDPIRKELVGDAGLLVNPAIISDYARTLGEALTKTWGDIPRKKAECYAWEKIARQYQQLFNLLIHN